MRIGNNSGGEINRNPDFAAVPQVVATKISPEPPAPTTALISVEETGITAVAGKVALPNITVVAPLGNVPEMLTVSPVLADVGEKLVIVGGKLNVNPDFVAVPFTVDT